MGKGSKQENVNCSNHLVVSNGKRISDTLSPDKQKQHYLFHLLDENA